MRIVLLRHGEPDVPEITRLRASEIHYWIKSYNAAGLKAGHGASPEAIEIANHCNAVVCSNLPRSFESALALGIKEVNYREPILREMELPYFGFPSPKLSPHIWAALFRTLWFLGNSSNGESLGEGRLRASNATARLKEIAENTESVLLVGHGLVNSFIAKELLSNGWRGPVSPGKKYWEFGIYEYTS
ncbi:MAG: phosphoglycerate mutase family protein [Methylobacter sp.]|nr:phosphoglycerate mutase family protein [Methylobacter sp.]